MGFKRESPAPQQLKVFKRNLFIPDSAKREGCFICEFILSGSLISEQRITLSRCAHYNFALD